MQWKRLTAEKGKGETFFFPEYYLKSLQNPVTHAAIDHDQEVCFTLQM